MRKITSFILIGITAVTLAVGFGTLPVTAAEQREPVGRNEQSRSVQGSGNDGTNRSGENVDPVSEKPVKETSVVEYISDAYRWLSIIGGLLAVIMLMYAGYSYTASNGDPEKVANAKDIVEKALIGLGLLIMAAVLLRTINPATINPNANQNKGCIDFTQPSGGNQQNRC